MLASGKEAQFTMWSYMKPTISKHQRMTGRIIGVVANFEVFDHSIDSLIQSHQQTRMTSVTSSDFWTNEKSPNSNTSV